MKVNYNREKSWGDRDRETRMQTMHYWTPRIPVRVKEKKSRLTFGNVVGAMLAIVAGLFILLNLYDFAVAFTM